MNLGLTRDVSTIPLAITLVFLWAISVRVTPGWRERKFSSVFTTLYGYTWVGFGVHFIFRYVLLAYDSFSFGFWNYRMSAMPPEVVNRSLLLTVFSWICIVLVYRLIRARSTAGPVASLAVCTPAFAHRYAVPVSCAASLGYLLLEGPWVRVPVALLTPGDLVCNLWVIPAAALWWDMWSQPMRRISALHLIVLCPGVIRATVSPYREHLVAPVLIPLVAALAANKRVKVSRVVAGGIVFLALATIIIRARRDEASYSETVASVVGGESSQLLQNPLSEPLRRFHGFDSLLYTVELVPRALPYSGQNVFAEAIVRAFVPRAFAPNKSQARKGQEFGRTIWTFYDSRAQLNATAAIIPTLPGDLYHAGGFPFVALGAAIWGAMVGACEGWGLQLPPNNRAGFVVLFATMVGGACARDFTDAVATLLQTLLVTVVIASVASRWLKTTGTPSGLPARRISGRERLAGPLAPAKGPAI